MSLFFSVDTECWFHANYDGVEPFGQYGFDDRLEHNIDMLLALLSECNINATFFVLSSLAHSHKEALLKIINSGHKISSHGINHRLLYTMNKGELRNELEHSKKTLQDALGVNVLGYRAASWSLSSDIYDDFYEILAEQGYKYSSSLYPAQKKLFGIKGAQSSPHIVATKFGDIFEFPCTTVKVGGVRSGFSGGSFLRIFPFWLIKLLHKKALGQNGVVDFYVHPREIDEKSKRIKLPPILSFVHYHGVGTSVEKIKKVAQLGKFDTFEDVVKNGRLLTNLPNTF